MHTASGHGVSSFVKTKGNEVTNDAIRALAEAHDVTGVILAGITREQWALPSPCTGWSVRDVAQHLISGNGLFLEALGSKPVTVPGDDLPEAFRCTAGLLIDAFGRPGVLERMVEVPFGTLRGAVALQLRVTEALVHGWDLAHATGQRLDFPTATVEQALLFSRGMVGSIPAGRRPFEPPQPAPADAPVIDQLAAFLGRRVGPGSCAAGDTHDSGSAR